MTRLQVAPHPQKKFGELRASEDVAPTYLATDYKSSPVVIIIHE